MRFVEPKTTTIETTYNGERYGYSIYQPYVTIEGVNEEPYPNYDDGATYNEGDFVIVPELKRIFRCAANNTQGIFPPSDPTRWVDYGFVNSYRMFAIDEGIGAFTEGEDVVMTFDFQRSDTIALIGATWEKVVIEQVDKDEAPIVGEYIGDGDGSSVEFETSKKPIYMKSEKVYVDGDLKTMGSDYDVDWFTGKIIFTKPPASGTSITIDYSPTLKTVTANGRDYGASSFNEYFFSDWADKTRLIINSFTRFIIDGMVWTPNSTLRLTFSGRVKIGALVFGLQEELGMTLYGTSMSFQDRSKIVTDEFTGARKIIRYGHVRVIKAEIMDYTQNYSDVAAKVGRIMSRNMLFIPTDDDKFAEMSIIAYIENGDLPTQNPRTYKAHFNLVGVME